MPADILSGAPFCVWLRQFTQNSTPAKMRLHSALRKENMNQPNLETDRLILRPFDVGDADDVQKLANNPNVSEMTLNIPYPYSRRMAIDWIDTHKEKWKLRTGAVFAVTNKENGELIGTVSLVSIKERSAEIGYWIGEVFWSKGYCSEAVKALMDLSIKYLQIDHFVAEHLSNNPASGKVMLKNGMIRTNSILKKDRTGKLSEVEVYQKSIT